MGGQGEVRFVEDRGREEAERIARAVEDEAWRIEAKFSRFQPQSALSALNRHASRGPVAVDPETALLVRQALELSTLTEGRFDPTVGALYRAWDFKSGRVPTEHEIAELMPEVDARAVELKGGAIRFSREVDLDLGGVGKEYAVDSVAKLLRDAGVHMALVNFSGDVRTLGMKGHGRPWVVGIQDPRDRNRCRFSIRIRGSAGIATSGDYERYFEKDGIRYHHLLDARTGMPARGLASATVLAGTALEAGCLATAAFLLGPTEGIDLLKRTPRVEGALITEAGRILATEGMMKISDIEHRELVHASAS